MSGVLARPSKGLAVRLDGAAYDYNEPDRQPQRLAAVGKVSSRNYDPQTHSGRQVLTPGDFRQAAEMKVLLCGWIVPRMYRDPDITKEVRAPRGKDTSTVRSVTPYDTEAVGVGVRVGDDHLNANFYALVRQEGSGMLCIGKRIVQTDVFFYDEYRNDNLTSINRRISV